ncbi:MAG: hypothetical protein R2771_07635 [Saprospiraceae bacterium]
MNAGLTIASGDKCLIVLIFIGDVDTDWQDAAFTTGNIHNQVLNFSGGTKVFNYSMNMDYFNNTSYFDVPQKYDRVSTTVNLGGQKEDLNMDQKISYSSSYKNNF